MSEMKIELQRNRLDYIATLATELRTGLKSPRLQEVITKLDLLQSHWDKFEKVHERLADAKTDALHSHAYYTEQWYNSGLTHYSYALSELRTLKDDIEKTLTPPGSSFADLSLTTPAHSSRSFLPKITLKNFSGEYTEWQSFADLFKTLVGSNPELTNVEKMHYLRSTLTGDASQLIASLPNSGASFATAWDLLVGRFENKRVLITAQLNRLLSPPSTDPRSARSLQTLLNSSAEAINSLRQLGAPVDHWDMMLVHLLVKNLDHASHEAWELHLGSNLEYPSLEELRTFLSGRARALENIEMEKQKSRPAQLSKPAPSRLPPPRIVPRAHTVTTERSPPVATPSTSHPCDDCNESHFIATCTSFKNRTPEQRAEIVRNRWLCYNCLGRHNARSCRNPARCRSCNEKHHTSLHESSLVISKPSGGSNQPGHTQEQDRSQALTGLVSLDREMTV